MGIDTAHYHGWQGRLRWPLSGAFAIVRVALTQVIRRKSYWFVFALGLTNFLLYFSVIYAQTQFPMTSRGTQNRVLKELEFDPEPPPGVESGYLYFMDQQSLVVMILLAFSGSLLVGSDFRMNALSFYLSRRIDRRHYILGKLLAVSAIVAMLTAVPALVLYLEYGLFTSSFDYYAEHWKVPVSIGVYALITCTVLSILLVTCAAYLQRMAPIAITWASGFLLLRILARQLERLTGEMSWRLIDPWNDIHFVARLICGFYRVEDSMSAAEITALQREYEMHQTAAWLLAGLCAVSLAALVYRVRAVEVVH